MGLYLSEHFSSAMAQTQFKSIRPLTVGRCHHKIHILRLLQPFSDFRGFILLAGFRQKNGFLCTEEDE